MINIRKKRLVVEYFNQNHTLNVKTILNVIALIKIIHIQKFVFYIFYNILLIFYYLFTNNLLKIEFRMNF